MYWLITKKSKIKIYSYWHISAVTGIADSKLFDISLMICLIRNFNAVKQPTSGFDQLPTVVETTPGADLARIKHYRNKMAHLDDNRLDNVYFKEAWDDVTGVR